MSVNQYIEMSDNNEARQIIMDTIKGLVGWRVIHSREDIIRFLCGEGFDIPDVSEDSITVSAPDEPGNTLTFTGYLFSSQFKLTRSATDIEVTTGEVGA